MKMRNLFYCLLLSAAVVALIGCQSTYYAVWEKLGKEKRHLLKDQIENARDDQIEASEEFQDALTRLKAFNDFEGGKLEKAYNRISDDYEAC